LTGSQLGGFLIFPGLSTPGNVKRCESPGRAGGLPKRKLYTERRTQQFYYKNNEIWRMHWYLLTEFTSVEVLRYTQRFQKLLLPPVPVFIGYEPNNPNPSYYIASKENSGMCKKEIDINGIEIIELNGRDRSECKATLRATSPDQLEASCVTKDNTILLRLGRKK